MLEAPAEPPAAEPETLALEPRLPAREAGALAAALLERRGRALRLDASKVAAIATPCVQVLLAAVRSWRDDGLAFGVVAPTPDFLASIGDLGLDLDRLRSEGG